MGKWSAYDYLLNIKLLLRFCNSLKHCLFLSLSISAVFNDK